MRLQIQFLIKILSSKAKIEKKEKLHLQQTSINSNQLNVDYYTVYHNGTNATRTDGRTDR